MLKTRAFQAAFLFVAIAFVSAPSVLAHTKMVESFPANGSEVAAGLTKMSVTFSKVMRLTVFQIKKLDDDQQTIPTSSLPASFQTSADITVEPLGLGPHKVTWTAIGKDGHVMLGTFEFSVTDKAADITPDVDVSPDQDAQ